jgi:hypothetical protein
MACAIYRENFYGEESESITEVDYDDNWHVSQAIRFFKSNIGEQDFEASDSEIQRCTWFNTYINERWNFPPGTEADVTSVRFSLHFKNVSVYSLERVNRYLKTGKVWKGK